jgi:putative pyruvate formate lyase activating enzyme
MLAHQRSARLPCPDLSVESLKTLDSETLWRHHAKGLAAYRQGHYDRDIRPTVSWLDLKRELAFRHLRQCDFCVHDCRVDRTAGQQGYCQLGDESPFSGAYLHWGEEPPLRPTWAVFFGGCTMHCVYCHNWRDTFKTREQPVLTPQGWINQLRAHAGSYRTLSFIGGTPEPHLHTLLAALCLLAESPDGDDLAAPVVFNSNATLSAVGLDLMEGAIDIYVPDYKHGNNTCAWALTKIAHYQQTLALNLQRYAEQKAGVLVRHLPLPGHLECCTYPVLADLARHYGQMAVNIMLEYQPLYKAELMPGIDRCLSPAEKEKIQQWVESLGLRQVAL